MPGGIAHSGNKLLLFSHFLRRKECSSFSQGQSCDLTLYLKFIFFIERDEHASLFWNNVKDEGKKVLYDIDTYWGL